MRMVVTVEFADAGTRTGKHRVLAVTRNVSYASSGDIGLSLAEAKNMLEYVQQEFVTAQAEELIERARVCVRCGRRLATKDVERRRVHTLFGLPVHLM